MDGRSESVRKYVPPSRELTGVTKKGTESEIDEESNEVWEIRKTLAESRRTNEDMSKTRVDQTNTKVDELGEARGGVGATIVKGGTRLRPGAV